MRTEIVTVEGGYAMRIVPPSPLAALLLRHLADPFAAYAGTGAVPRDLVLERLGYVPAPEVTRCRDCTYDANGKRIRCCTRHRTTPMPTVAAEARERQAARRAEAARRKELRLTQVARLLAEGVPQAEIRRVTRTGYATIAKVRARGAA